MLYVDDVAAEKAFWSAAGFVILSESEMMGFETFDMKPHADSSTTFTVYAKEFIRQVSPEVIDMQPSPLWNRGYCGASSSYRKPNSYLQPGECGAIPQL